MISKLHTNSFRWLLSGAFISLLFSACNPVRDRLGNVQQVNLVANNGSYAGARVDPGYVNGWGFDFSPFGPAFISSNGTGTSVIYGTVGDERRTAISIPGAGELSLQGEPSGVVFNGTDDFQLTTNFNPARFIYAGTDGVVSAWNEADAAISVINNSATASYTGIAIAADAGANFLYAANFKEAKVEVYDAFFTAVDKPFTDPSLPSGYSPYNIRNIDGQLYITYAKQGTNGNVETGAGKGYVNIYNPDGSLSRRFASGGKLNAPWGITKTNAANWNIGASGSSILVGNYGDGRINSFSLGGSNQGTLKTEAGLLSIQGLRAIGFAPDSAVAEAGKLFFTAGPNGGQDGLFGYLQTVQP